MYYSRHTAQKMRFPLRISSVNLRETADLVRFTEEILNGKLHFLCSELLDRKTRKILTCNCLLHPRANAARLSLKKCEGRKRLIAD